MAIKKAAVKKAAVKKAVAKAAPAVKAKTWKLQGTVNDKYDGKLHLQGKGEEVNRDYGYAGEVELTPEELETLKAVEGKLDSLAGTGAKYFAVTVTKNDKRAQLKVGKFQKNVLLANNELRQILK